MTASRAPAADELLVGFAHVLRAAGMAVTPNRTSAFVEAVALTGFHDRAATYWSGRATLCSSLDDSELYDKAFTAWFTPLPDGSRPATPVPAPRQPQASLEPESGARDVSGDDLIAARASTAEVLRHRDVGSLTEQERAQLAMLFDTLEVVAPLRRALRQRPHHRGSVDLRRTLRAQLRAGGELVRLPPPRARPRRPRGGMRSDT